MHSKRIHKKVKQVYDSIADDFSKTREVPWPVFNDFLAYIPQGARVLDLGCGNGRFYKFLSEHKETDYTGVDISSRLLAVAKERFPKAKWILSDMTECTSSEAFDVILMIASFHHLSPEYQLKQLEWIYSHLKPGGHLLMSNWNLRQKSMWNHWLKRFFRLSWAFDHLMIPWANGNDRYYYSFTPGRLGALLRKSKLMVQRNDYERQGKKSNILNGANIITIAQK